jgi:hypothetical protein
VQRWHDLFHMFIGFYFIPKDNDFYLLYICVHRLAGWGDFLIFAAINLYAF